LAENGIIIHKNGGSKNSTLEALRVFGFDAKTSYAAKVFTCIIKIPLQPQNTSPIPILAGDGKRVGLSFEGTEFTTHRSSGESGGSGNVTDRFYFWERVILAEKPDVGPARPSQ
jgi:hypothetical protein